jgi:hypothetical protein
MSVRSQTSLSAVNGKRPASAFLRVGYVEDRRLRPILRCAAGANKPPILKRLTRDNRRTVREPITAIDAGKLLKNQGFARESLEPCPKDEGVPPLAFPRPEKDVKGEDAGDAAMAWRRRAKARRTDLPPARPGEATL